VLDVVVRAELVEAELAQGVDPVQEPGLLGGELEGSIAVGALEVAVAPADDDGAQAERRSDELPRLRTAHPGRAGRDGDDIGLFEPGVAGPAVGRVARD